MDDNKELFAIINKTPVLQSLLYDLNLLPDQLKEHTKEWDYMMTTVHHVMLAIASASQPAEPAGDEPIVWIRKSTLSWAQSGAANGIDQCAYRFMGGSDGYVVPLYTHPPVREVMMDEMLDFEQIEESFPITLFPDIDGNLNITVQELHDFARSIEMKSRERVKGCAIASISTGDKVPTPD